jgi:hypothetical protein
VYRIGVDKQRGLGLAPRWVVVWPLRATYQAEGRAAAVDSRRKREASQLDRAPARGEKS